MKWTPGGTSDDLDDIRGQGGGGGGGGSGGGGRGLAVPLTGGGIVIAIVLTLLSQVLGVNLTGGGGGGGASSSSSSAASSPHGGSGARAGRGGADDPDRKTIQFVSFVLDDVQKTYEQLFRARGLEYTHARLEVFTSDVDTGCGESSAAVGPFYCPPDRKAYIDLSFFDELRDRFGASGEFAEAYVLAHELGHHVQNLLGTDAKMRDEVRRHPGEQGDQSVRLELQADCYAGVWGHSTAQRDLLEQGEMQQALDAAASIGDDRLQKMAGRRVNPETWTHGSSAERMRWFKKGFDGGRLEDCDTFAAATL